MSGGDVRIRIGDWTFTRAIYDAERDVLYLSIGDIPEHGGYGEETPEGHILRFTDDDQFYGVTLVGINDLIERDENLGVTVPPRPRQEKLPTTAIHRALTAA